MESWNNKQLINNKTKFVYLINFYESLYNKRIVLYLLYIVSTLLKKFCTKYIKFYMFSVVIYEYFAQFKTNIIYFLILISKLSFS